SRFAFSRFAFSRFAFEVYRKSVAPEPCGSLKAKRLKGEAI
ncbi:MAG: hypothetical protein ACI9G6_002760, partial [Limisphaerales bacterium]